MKACPYCGRENDDRAINCSGCGSDLSHPVANAQASPAEGGEHPARHWLGQAARLAGLLVLVIFFYLLSFGPVQRYCGTVRRGTTPPQTNLVNGRIVVVAMTRSVRYPQWVGVLYFPALAARNVSGPSGLYERYLDWWWEEGPGTN